MTVISAAAWLTSLKQTPASLKYQRRGTWEPGRETCKTYDQKVTKVVKKHTSVQV